MTPEQFALAQTEDEDQDVGRIQDIIVAAGAFGKLACSIQGPGVALPRALGVVG